MAYNILKPVQLISAGDMSGSITSGAVEIMLQDNVGIQLKWTGTPTGSFDVQISSDHLQGIDGQVAGNWISLPLSPAISAAGSPDVAYIDLNQMSARYLRVVYNRTGGTGSLDCIVVGKGI